MIHVVHPGSGSRIWILTFPDPGIKKAPDPGSATLLPPYGIYYVGEGYDRIQACCRVPVDSPS
jgi:hypothetical protein